jgi:hypothetical protein
MSTPRRHISLLKPGGVDRGTYGPQADGNRGVELSEPSIHRAGRAPGPPARGTRSAGGHRGVIVALVIALFVLVGALFALVFVGASVTPSSTALAGIAMPLSGGHIERVSVVTGPHSRPIPVTLRGNEIWPRGLVPVGEPVSIEAVIKRPGWISWLAGASERVRLSLVTPSARLRDHYLTLASGAPLRLHFEPAVSTVSYGQEGSLSRRTLSTPQAEVTLPRSGAAGSIMVAAAPRPWEIAGASPVSYFPPGASAAAVASPAPGARIDPGTPIALTFSEPVEKALGSARPVISPSTPGEWQTTGTHTIAFHPSGYGYGLSTTVTVALPNGVRLVGGQSGSAATASWTVPGGSTLRLQQLLAQLGYLPVRFREHGPRVALTPAAQEAAAVSPPPGAFTWRYGDVPGTLRGDWKPGASGELTRGAIMALENRHEMTADGEAGSAVWKALLADAIAQRHYTFGYSFVNVNEGSQSLSVWHDGRTVMTTPVNTGIASRPTETGTFAVYEHVSSGTMSGTNPDGSHYSDPGVPWISYFNGGDALHGFERAQYGSPQSLGCVEMPISTAGRVWPYTPVGTIVNVQ